MNPQRTLPQLFEDSVARFADQVLMLEKKTDKYEGTTYTQMRGLVHQFAAGLLSLGIQKGDRLSLIADARNDWVTSELGMFYAGAVDVPISVKIEDLADLTFRLSHSGCRAVVVTQSQIEKIRKIKKNLPDLQTTIVLDELKSYEADEIPVADVFRKGAEFLATTGPRSRSAGARSGRTITPTSATPPGRPPIPRGSSSPTATTRPTSSSRSAWSASSRGGAPSSSCPGTTPSPTPAASTPS